MANLPPRNTCLISEGLTHSVKLAFTTGENAPESRDSHVLQPTHLCLLFLPPTTPSLPSCSFISSLRTMQTEGLGEPIPDVMGSLYRISRMSISSTVMGLSSRGGCHLGGTQLPPRNGYTVLDSHTEFSGLGSCWKGFWVFNGVSTNTIKVVVTQTKQGRKVQQKHLLTPEEPSSLPKQSRGCFCVLNLLNSHVRGPVTSSKSELPKLWLYLAVYYTDRGGVCW